MKPSINHNISGVSSRYIIINLDLRDAGSLHGCPATPVIGIFGAFPGVFSPIYGNSGLKRGALCTAGILFTPANPNSNWLLCFWYMSTSYT
jgi:hypothetical protein